MNHLAPALPQQLSAILNIYLQPGLSFRQFQSIFHAYRKHALIILLSVIAVEALVMLFLPKTYKATAALMVDFDINDPLGGKEFPTGLMSNYLATQRDLIESPAVLLPAITKANLSSDPHYTAGYRQDAGDISNWVIEKVRKNLQVDLGNYGSQFIYISYSAKSAAEASNIANIIAHIYADQQFQRVNDPARERATRYKAQLEQLKQDVDRAQANVSEFRHRTGSVDFNSAVDVSGERLTDLEHRLIEAQEMRRVAEQHASTNGALQGSALGANTVQTLKNTQATQKARLSELQQTLGPSHPDILQLKSEIAATQSSLNAELGTYAESAQSDFQGASKIERELQAAVDQERTKVLQARQQKDEGATYLQALQAAQTLYQSALTGYDQVLLASSGSYSNVSIVSPATPPVKASRSKAALKLAYALVAGTILALLGPLFFEFMNRRVRCKDDIERGLGIPVLMEFGSPAARQTWHADSFLASIRHSIGRLTTAESAHRREPPLVHLPEIQPETKTSVDPLDGKDEISTAPAGYNVVV